MLLASFERLNARYYREAVKTLQPQLAIGRRISNFNEVKGGPKGIHTLLDSRRCLGFGNGSEKDYCFGICVAE